MLMTTQCKLSRMFTRLRTIRSDTSGISLTEFALILPIVLTLGLYGTEIARLSTTKMKVSQIALSLADNASRLGQTDNSGVTPTITEDGVDAVISGAIRAGDSIDLGTNGRIILSSLEYDDFSDKQYIHWQRCQGDRDADSLYGDDGTNNGLTGDELEGMGKGTNKITALSGQAVMFVEIEYEYSPLFQNPFGSGTRTFREEAAYLIRDDRNLGPGLTGGSSQSDCDS